MGIWSPGPAATSGNDVFTGDGSGETADGLGGSDTLNGNDGADTLRPGDDYVADIVSGGNGSDIVDYSLLSEDGIIFLGTIAYRSYFDSSSLWDSISGVEEVRGTAASDIIISRAGGPTVLRGGAGNDFLGPQTSGNTAFYGDAGRDTFWIAGGDSFRIMDYTLGVDRLASVAPRQIASIAIDGADTLLTVSNGGGVVRIVGINSLSLAQWQAQVHMLAMEFDSTSDVADIFNGGADDDWAWGGSQNDTLNGADGDDTLNGGQGNDTLNGGANADYLEGGSGDDILNGGVGGDTLIGNSGSDTASYAGSSGQVGVDLSTNTGTFGDAVGDSYTSVENVTGTDFGDGITGDNTANILRGGDGNDSLYGLDGDDTLIGGVGQDLLVASFGNDTFELDLAGLQAGDFFLGESGVDTIRIGDTASGQQLFNFGPANVDSIEQLQFTTTNGSAVAIAAFAASQLGAGFANNLHVIGSSTLNIVSIVAGVPATFSVANWTFESWQDGADMVLLDGSSGADIITGSSVRDFISGHDGADQVFGGGGFDTIEGGAGADLMHGDAGDDTFRVTDTDATPVTGDLFDGGADTDTVALLSSLNVAFWDLRGANFSSIERLDFGVTTPGDVAWAQINASQIGAGFVSNLTVDGSTRTDVLQVVNANGGFMSLQTFVFLNWTPNDDYVEIDGHATLADFITGSPVDDQMEGLGGNDTLSGLNGTDVLDGGAGNDVLSGGGGTDFLLGGAGRDTAVFLGSAADAQWHRNASGSWNVVTSAGGQDILQGTEFIQFADRTVFLDRAAYTFSGDGASDILLYRASDGVTAIWSVDGATVTSAAPTLWQAGTAWGVEGVGDFNADGRDDFLLRRHSDGVTAIWQMNGTNVTAADVTLWQAGNEWVIAGVGDFNGDNRDDIVWRRASDGVMSIWNMDGFSVASADVTSQQAGTAWNVAAIGDFNGDGRDDLLIRNTDGATAVWTMNGTTVTGANLTSVQAGNDWNVAGAGDFNGDGVDDILMRHSSGAMAVWTMAAGGTVQSSVLTSQSADAAWNVANVGDYNGDGRDDLLLVHSSGATAIWIMDGATVESAMLTSQQAGTEWGFI